MKNIMFLSAGRRVELVKCFLEAIKTMKCDAKVIACDCSKTAPALYFADEWFQLPKIDNSNYIESIIECAKL